MRGGVVFNTTDPNVVIRVGPDESSDREMLMADEDMQETGGVVRIYHQMPLQVGGETYLASWKEQISEFVEAFLMRNYGDQYDEIGAVLAGLYHCNRDGLKVLMKCPATKGLAQAIRLGLPVDDLALDHNLGVTKDGRVVAFDI